jgi:cytochrome c556
MVIAVGGETLARAQSQAGDIAQTRIAHFREIGTAYKQIGDELKSRTPDLPRIEQSAKVIKNLGADILNWFPPNSEPAVEAPQSWLDKIVGWFSSSDSYSFFSETRSHAKHAIWTDRALFEQAHTKFTTEADRMWQAARSGQVAATSAEFKRLGGTCKGCHDDFREKID